MKGFDTETLVEFEKTNLALGKPIQNPDALFKRIQDAEQHAKYLQNCLDTEIDANEAQANTVSSLADALQSVLDLLDEVCLKGNGETPYTLNAAQQRVYDEVRSIWNQS
jgi:hypothetical protein